MSRAMFRFVPLPSSVVHVLAASLVLVARLAIAQCTGLWQPGPEFGPQLPTQSSSDVIYDSTLWDPDGTGYQQPRLVVCGAFSSMGGVAANNVAYYDGTNWINLGQGFNGAVITVASFNNELYAGGTFTLSGSTAVTRVAKYNNTTHAWGPVGSGFDNFVRQLRVHQNQLFAAGDFGASGSVATVHIARLVSGAWQALPGGGVNGPVYALHSLGLNLYVGGQFTSVGSSAPLAVHNLASWNSTSIWQDCNGGVNGGSFHSVYALGDDGGNLLVGGDFATTHNTSVASRNFGIFVPGSPGIWISGINFPGNQVEAIIGNPLTPTEIYATTSGGGGAICYKYSNLTWTPLPGGVPTGFAGYALSKYQGEVVMSGIFTAASVGGAYLDVARLHANTWQPLHRRLNAPIRSFLPLGSTLDIGGDFEQTDASFNFMAGVATWNGSGISEPGIITGPVKSMFFSSNGITIGNTFFGGTFNSAGGVGGVNNLAEFLGVGFSWSAVVGGVTNSNGTPASVNSIVGFGRTSGPLGVPILHIAGNFDRANGVTVAHVAKLVSGAWQSLGTGMTSITSTVGVNAMSVFSSQLYAGGVFDAAGGVTSNSIARWNGTAWSNLGTGVQLSGAKGTVDALTVFNNQLIIAGQFNSAGGVAVNNLAAFDGTNLLNMSAGLDPAIDEVTALGQYDGQLFAAAYDINFGTPRAQLYRWTGAAWSPVGAPADAPIRAMATFKNRLHVGGEFSKIGTATDSPYWAILSCFCVADVDDGTGSGTPDNGVTIDDLIFFLQIFEAGDSRADVDDGTGSGTPDGGVTVDDLLYFLARFEAGC